MITGAAQGIGAEIARVFSKEGAKIAIADVKEAEGCAMEAELQKAGGTAMFVKLDVTSEAEWKRAVQAVVGRFGKLDILVNNAGISKRSTFEEYPVEWWDLMFAVNVKGPMLGTRTVLPVMRKQGGGAIVNMSSIAGMIGHKTSSEAYIATKAAVNMFTKAIAVHYAKDNIRSNSLHPCTVETALVTDLFKDPEKKKARMEEVPMGRIATTTDVAYAALYLASDEASFITGVSLPVDGGLTAY